MRQICPNCQQSVNINDAEAGKTVACPSCQQPFAVPSLFTATVFETPVSAPPAPSLAPSLPESSIVAPASPMQAVHGEPAVTATSLTPSPSVPIGYSRHWSLPLNRTLCQWLPPICLTLIFFFSFSKWIGLYPGGYPAYTQNGWQALIADISVDPVSEKHLKLEASLNDRLPSSWWLLPYMILMVVGVLIAWAEPFINTLKLKKPPFVENMWRFRPALLGACAGLTLFLLLLQSAAGFGFDRAVTSKVQEVFRQDREKAKTPEEIQKVEMEVAGVLGGLHLRTTIWLRGIILLHIFALVGIIGETLLLHRGDKPPPRVGVMW